MAVQYFSSRNQSCSVNGPEAVLKGLAPDGGLFVPSQFPQLPFSLEDLSTLSYIDIAVKTFKAFLPSFSEEELKELATKAYSPNFPEEPVPLKSCDNTHFLELFHGPTSAFKDVALSFLPYLMTASAKKLNHNEKIFILTATSGDTGKAAMAGFQNVPGTEIAVFFPENGTSLVQKLQMVTQQGNNTFVFGMHGNFDDAQSGVKKIFEDKSFHQQALELNTTFSSANSINIGRLLPQMVYYLRGYGLLIRQGKIKAGDPVNICVPTGNFGNILAAYYASRCGLPVKKFICASNKNRVLTDFFHGGHYDRNRDFVKTTSPSMDILISSNLERLLYHISGEDATLVNDLMSSLKEKGEYHLPKAVKPELQHFYASSANDYEAADFIAEIFDQYDYLIDPHTAVAVKVLDDYREVSGDYDTPTLLAATASPYKFPRAVCEAINLKFDESLDDCRLLEILYKASGMPIPENLKDLDKKEIVHKTVILPEEMKEAIAGILKKG